MRKELAIADPKVQIISTWFHADQAGFGGEYSQTLGDSQSRSHYAIYLRCILVFFISLVAHGRTERRILFINNHADKILEENFREKLRKLKVEIIVLENTHIPSERYVRKWRNQFFMLDVIKKLSELEITCAILDSDILINSNKEITLRQDMEILAYAVSNNPSEIINGLSVETLNFLNLEFTGAFTEEQIQYLGGEFLVIRGDKLKEFYNLCQLIYEKNQKRAALGQEYCQEEAHLFSIASAQFKVDSNGSQIISRIWTQPWTYRKIPTNWNTLIFWHLPAEKKTGLQRLYRKLITETNLEDAGILKSKLDKNIKMLGVPRYQISKFFFDMYDLRAGFTRHLRRRFLVLFQKVYK